MATAQKDDLTGSLIEILRLNYFENDEIISLVSDLETFEQPLRDVVLELCLVLARESAHLLPNVLNRVKKAAQNLSAGEMEKWISSGLAILRSEGSVKFTHFITKVSEANLRIYRDLERVRFREVAHTLEIYLKAISGLELGISTDTEAYTDTEAVYFPTTLARYTAPKKDLLLYLLMAAHKWAQLALGTLTPDLHKFVDQKYSGSAPYDIDLLFRLFPERNLAVDLYILLEAFMIESFLKRELPGLMREADKLKARIFEERPSLDTLNEKTAFVEGIYHYYLAGYTKGAGPEALLKAKDKVLSLREAKGTDEIVDLLIRLYEEIRKLKGEYRPNRPAFFLGTMRPDRISHKLHEKKGEKMKKVEEAVRKLSTMSERDIKSMLSGAVAQEKTVKAGEEYLAVEGKIVGLDEEEKEYVRSAGGISGGTLVRGENLESGRSYIPLRYIPVDEQPIAQSEGFHYDEWDYRQGDYKRQWCTLYEQEVVPVEEPFVEETLRRYSGYLSELKRRFAAFRSEPKLLKRQDEGEDIDIDAMVEAFADMRAGLSPGDRLFVRTNKEKRDVAALFLVDMSGSTKGWVNVAEKESLVLLCEAMESLGDKYAIYGFSGTSRMKCDYYRIKRFGEPYAGQVKGRIAAIIPKDYTRMGPPIRHSTALLKPVDARIRLLITISDGKPEDWGAYRGEYGIEDTRRALGEAKEQGIHPFCITIDEEAGAYLPRIFGEVNYIVIDDARELPTRIMEIYRRIAF